jgi:heme-degrading monooxygenase HmoA
MSVTLYILSKTVDGRSPRTRPSRAVHGREDDGVFAITPEPPYVAVIFTSLRNDDDHGAYDEMADAMGALAEDQPGYLGIESVRDPVTRLGITVSYWRSDDDARRWKQVGEHLAAQRLGRDRWYDRYTVRIATVGRAYGSPG